MTITTHELAYRLAQCAEAVCRRYLSAGRRQGNYWLVGDVRNLPGRSMFVRLEDSSNGPAGKWTDAATGEHGDLLDVIREALGLLDFSDVVTEARSFLSLPYSMPHPGVRTRNATLVLPNVALAAQRLFAMSQPLGETLAQTYLRNRGIKGLRGTESLRFHPRCFYRSDGHSPIETWPAMIAAVADLHGNITGAQRIWLASDGVDKAPADTQRKAMGELLGHAVRFGRPGDVMAAGEGIETVLSLLQVPPQMVMAAALSAAHLAAILFPVDLRRLYVVRDKDSTGHGAD